MQRRRIASPAADDFFGRRSDEFSGCLAGSPSRDQPTQAARWIGQNGNGGDGNSALRQPGSAFSNGWLYLALLCWTLILPAAETAQAGNAMELLTNAAQVKALSVAQAAEKIPVRVQGVVTGEGKDGIVIQDATMGIFIYSGTNNLSWVHRGDLVEIIGVSDPGEFAPVILQNSVRKIGTAPIPLPMPLDYEELTSGSADGQWVEASGIVRDCKPVGNYEFKLTLASGGMRLTVQFFGATNVVESLVDAEVRLRGIIFYQFNHSRQILSPVMMVPDSPQLTVEKPAPAEPYSAPLRQPQSLMLYSPKDLRHHRVRMPGMVIHQISGQAIWLRAAGQGLRVETRQVFPLQPGDTIEALGFPGSGDYTPILEDAIYRKTASATNSPAPLRVNKKVDALAHDADLIQLEGELQELTRTINGWQVTLNWNNLSLLATLQDLQPLPANWEPGSFVQITGICHVTTDSPSTAGGIREPREFQLLLRSPADLRVVKNKLWWTTTRILVLLGLATILSLLAVASVAWMARQRLREQALRRKMAEAEFSAMFAERNRIAREIHDTLAQGLGAISMHLEMVKEQLNREPAKVLKHLDIAHQMARQSLGEARNSIWNMRSQILENTDLASALEGILHQLTEGTDIKSQFTVTGAARRLASAIENNLLRVGQEAITNAVRHSQARSLVVTLDFSPSEASLSVRDDGSGFDPAQLPAGTHFGMIGQRERTAQMGGKLEVISSPGQGTEVQVSIPIYE